MHLAGFSVEPVLWRRKGHIGDCQSLHTWCRGLAGRRACSMQAQLVAQTVSALLCCGLEAADIGVICFFKAQVRRAPLSGAG